MSRIRVYDLAKEADMPSKELAEKLIALGYNIKSHSSSVEDDVADEIRRKVIGTAETEVVEKRISTKGRATVIRRRSQTVRRAPEPPPVEEEVPEETIETEKEEVEEKPAPKPVRKKAAKKKKEKTEPEKVVAVDAAEEAVATDADEEAPVVQADVGMLPSAWQHRFDLAEDAAFLIDAPQGPFRLVTGARDPAPESLREFPVAVRLRLPRPFARRVAFGPLTQSGPPQTRTRPRAITCPD